MSASLASALTEQERMPLDADAKMAEDARTEAERFESAVSCSVNAFEALAAAGTEGGQG